MDLTQPSALARIRYEELAEEYLRSLPLEHFMEDTAQAAQRKITLASFDLIHARRPDVQVFNELLVQYPAGGKVRHIVPDNMVVVHPEPIRARGSFELVFQPVGPLLVLEYVSKHSRRKDYDDNMAKYERDLKVPYYLLFYPDGMDLNLYHRKRSRYASVHANAAGRFEVPELELEAAILDDWVRFWFRGEMQPLPGEMLQMLNAESRRRMAAEAEVARLRAELDRMRQSPGTTS